MYMCKGFTSAYAAACSRRQCLITLPCTCGCDFYSSALLILSVCAIYRTRSFFSINTVFMSSTGISTVFRPECIERVVRSDWTMTEARVHTRCSARRPAGSTSEGLCGTKGPCSRTCQVEKLLAHCKWPYGPLRYRYHVWLCATLQ